MIHILPTPHENKLSEVYTHLTALTSFSPELEGAFNTLFDFAKRACKIEIKKGTGGIEFLTDASLPEEGYSLAIRDGRATVRAADVYGAHNAAATLAQIMKKDGDGISLPSGELFDRPECSWRGVMLDLARNWHPMEMVYEYVDMCRFYKVKYLHLHFCDDQSFTLPSRAFPKLPTKGRSYTEEQIKGLIDYAKLRGIRIVPEIDVPGHTAAFGAAYGEIFGTNGIICQGEQSMAAIKTVFGELCELFADAEYIHIGGDEAYNIPKWTTCPKCTDAYRKMGVDVDGMDKKELEQLMYATFLKKVCEMILAFGKTPVLWEGFAKQMNALIPKEAVVMSWENLYQTTPSLLEDGFRVVNCSWVPMYILAPDKYWSPRDVYEWNVYYWKPCHPRSPYFGSDIRVAPTNQIEGGELLAWGDHIIWSYPDDIEAGIRDEQRLVEERVPCLAENTWNRTKKSDDKHFFASYVALQKAFAQLKANK